MDWVWLGVLFVFGVILGGVLAWFVVRQSGQSEKVLTQTQLSELQEEKSKLFQELEAETVRFRESNQAYTDLNLDYVRLQAQFDEQGRSYANLMTQHGENQNQIQVLAEQVAVWKEKAARFEEQNLNLNVTVQQQSLKNQQWEVAHSELTEQLNRKEHELSRLNTQLAQMQEVLVEKDQLSKDKQLIIEEKQTLKEELVSVQTQLAGEIQKQANHQDLLKTASNILNDQFKLLAQQVLSEAESKFTHTSKKDLHSLLNPLSEQIKQFNVMITEHRDKDSRERVELVGELKKLQELNQSLHSDAKNLTDALVGTKNKTQGTWGEMILSTVLKHSGLREDMEFSTQVSLNVLNEEGRSSRIQPDVMINLPDNKCILVDAKVSLTAYTRYIQTHDEACAAEEMKSHLMSLRRHIDELAKKSYPLAEGIVSLDFVLMFIPNEAAYIDALNHAPELLEEGLNKNVLLVCPSTLLIALKTINNMWRDERTNKNAQMIAESAGRLHDKLVGALEALEKVGKNLDATKQSYDIAMGRLSIGRGNVISQAKRLQELGAKTGKNISEQWYSDEIDG